ncbi:hypothetical protein ACLB9X_17520 [Streptomyces sp. 5K101]|uniref:hypothetical protein n=1 Tax=Streptomyces sp. 5K101 TaxID=3390037 RepID=UPI0039769011
MADRISALISALGVLPASFLLVYAVREHRAGSSVLWVVAGALLVLVACTTLVRDVRRLLAAPEGDRED